ncbi:unnamed protein product, partial [Urochloa humidicola]
PATARRAARGDWRLRGGRGARYESSPRSVPRGGVGSVAAVEAAAVEADGAAAGDDAGGSGCVVGGDRAAWIEGGRHAARHALHAARILPPSRIPAAAAAPLPRPRRAARPCCRTLFSSTDGAAWWVPFLPQGLQPLLRARLGPPLAHAAPTRVRCGLRRRGGPCGVVFQPGEGDDEDGKVVGELTPEEIAVLLWICWVMSWSGSAPKTSGDGGDKSSEPVVVILLDVTHQVLSALVSAVAVADEDAALGNGWRFSSVSRSCRPIRQRISRECSSPSPYFSDIFGTLVGRTEKEDSTARLSAMVSEKKKKRKNY